MTFSCNENSKITLKCTDNLLYHTTLNLWRELFSLLFSYNTLVSACYSIISIDISSWVLDSRNKKFKLKLRQVS